MHSAASRSTQAKKKRSEIARKPLVLYGHGKGTKRKEETIHKLSQKIYREITKKAKGDAPIELDDESGKGSPSPSTSTILMGINVAFFTVSICSSVFSPFL